MTKFIAKLHTNGTSVSLQAPGRNPESALARILRNKLARNASTIVIYARKDGAIALAVPGPRLRPSAF